MSLQMGCQGLSQNFPWKFCLPCGGVLGIPEYLLIADCYLCLLCVVCTILRQFGISLMYCHFVGPLVNKVREGL